MTASRSADVDGLVRRWVRPGDHLHLAATQSRPNALTYALCRVFGSDGDFTVSTTAVHSAAHALTIAGAVRRMIAGFLGDTYPTPRPNPLYADVANGHPFAFEPWSLLSYQQRLAAGATGVPYAASTSLLGSDLLRDKDGRVHVVPDPGNPEAEVALLSALRPDLTLVHGAVADERGNVALFAPLGESGAAAYAARRGVLASVERIVSNEEFARFTDRVIVPGQRVLGLCEAPFGAHPQSLRLPADAAPEGASGYLDDYEFLEQIVTACAEPDRGADWYREWVIEPGSHEGYLAKLGRSRLDALTGDQRHRVAPAASEPTAATEPAVEPAVEQAATEQERLIVLGARAVAERVRSGRYDTLLAGIGSSHLAAWLAGIVTRDEGYDVKIVAELGAYGFEPEPGDVFLFSLRHAERAEGLAGITEILGGMVAANPRALGVLGAAEVDRFGNVNTSLSRSGRWLTGSGGANDIASHADCVVVASAGPRRYVDRVGYVTSPGRRVIEVVSQFGRFVRGAEGFELSRLLETEGENLPDDPAELAAAGRQLLTERTGWQAVAGRVVVDKPVTAEELALLRRLDPDGRYR